MDDLPEALYDALMVLKKTRNRHDADGVLRLAGRYAKADMITAHTYNVTLEYIYRTMEGGE